jgi:hypothetical protein
MNIHLTALDARLIGCLIEKEITTPDQYPLSLNALLAAANQKNNRDPVLSLSEREVQFTVESLQRRHLLVEKSGFGSRVPKYQHRFCNTEYGTLKFTPQELAIVCELLLRGRRPRASYAVAPAAWPRSPMPPRPRRCSKGWRREATGHSWCAWRASRAGGRRVTRPPSSKARRRAAPGRPVPDGPARWTPTPRQPTRGRPSTGRRLARRPSQETSPAAVPMTATAS